MARTIILGYGNPDRQDDGVAWHVIQSLAVEMGVTEGLEGNEGLLLQGTAADLLFQLQLTPEIAEVIAGYDRACFVDAHTGAVKEDLNIVPLSASYQTSPFTHHMTPQTCLSIAQNLFHRSPENAILVSIRGYDFGFSRDLTDQTRSLARKAAGEILKWVRQPEQ